jgi:IS5 family transposase
MGVFNPIRSVNGNTSLPAPAVYQWDEQDVSAKDAGRNDALTMKKKRKGQLRALKVEYRMLTHAECAAVLQEFDPEYVDLDHLDAKEGGWITRKFYVGDRSAVSYNVALGKWESLAFRLTRVEAKMDRLHI